MSNVILDQYLIHNEIPQSVGKQFYLFNQDCASAFFTR